MKAFNKTLLIASLALFLSMTANAQNAIYKKFAGKDNVTAVYISKPMMRMASGFVKKDLNLSNVLSQLTGMYILTSTDSIINKDLRKEGNILSQDKSYELMMEVKEEEHVRFLSKPTSKPDIFKDLLMVVDSPEEYVIIQIEGEMSMKDIEGIMNKK